MKIEEEKKLIMAELADLKTSTWSNGSVRRCTLHWGLRHQISQIDKALKSLAEEGRIIVKNTNNETWISLA